MAHEAKTFAKAWACILPLMNFKDCTFPCEVAAHVFFQIRKHGKVVRSNSSFDQEFLGMWADYYTKQGIELTMHKRGIKKYAKLGWELGGMKTPRNIFSRVKGLEAAYHMDRRVQDAYYKRPANKADGLAAVKQIGQGWKQSDGKRVQS